EIGRQDFNRATKVRARELVVTWQDPGNQPLGFFRNRSYFDNVTTHRLHRFSLDAPYGFGPVVQPKPHPAAISGNHEGATGFETAHSVAALPVMNGSMTRC